MEGRLLIKLSLIAGIVLHFCHCVSERLNENAGYALAIESATCMYYILYKPRGQFYNLHIHNMAIIITGWLQM